MSPALVLVAVLAAPAGPPEAIPAAWLDRTAALESGGDDRCVGDVVRGVPRSRGRYQIQELIWRKYSERPWRTAAHEPAEARRVARKILQACARACRRHGQAVTFANVRWWYRHGGY